MISLRQGSTVILAAAGVLIAPQLTVALVCSSGTSWPSLRPDHASWFVARATSDSVLVGTFYDGLRGVTTRKPDLPARRFAVYGQLATVTGQGMGGFNRLVRGQKVILIWWSYGMVCERIAPRSALMLPAGAEVFVSRAVRPRAQWIDGLPTFDVGERYIGTSAVYAPELKAHVIYHSQGPVAIDPMSALEFAHMYASLPPWSWLRHHPRESMQFLLTWAEQHPRAASRYPATSMVEMARVNLSSFR